ncbi:Rho-binding antiterminator [Thiohalomonas denitrificans]|uniref:Transcriptional antiterminator, Rof n=1 Tax=Thiohalomonas denitrificans TaxID=415747 RepID=A0A1G5QSS1_9GAMM|nr:Rho-binding antiterminator [Thiohalomonas denitrificans]SCZ64905.1 transcriptional antiterminator, Rof [Thiohalomonas denitrificans]
MSDDYRPIDCEVYSGYELAIMHRQRLRMHWRDIDGNCCIGTLRPLDLKTEASKEEFLFVEDLDGRHFRIRLDRIVSAEAVILQKDVR